jgi:hypothetical protein
LASFRVVVLGRGCVKTHVKLADRKTRPSDRAVLAW